MSDAPTPPGDSHGIVVEHVVRGRSTWGTRLRADGSAEEWSDAGGWRPLVAVAADDVAGFLALARSGGFLDLPATIETDPPVDDGTEISWSIELDGRSHQVVAREPSQARNPVLVALDAELQRIVGEALNRAADAAEEADGDDGADEIDAADAADAAEEIEGAEPA